jgi:hypothetical protein
MTTSCKCQQCGEKFRAYPNRKGSLGVLPKFCSRECYASYRRANAATVPVAAKTIRVPERFYVDHMERALPTPEDVGSLSNHALVRSDDPALGELLSDAEHYAHPSGPDAAPRGVIASAKATVRAIRNVIGWNDAEPSIKALRN